MDLRTTSSSTSHRTRPSAGRPSAGRRPPAAVRRPSLYLAVAVAGAVMVGVVAGGEPTAQAEPELASVGIAEQLGLSADLPAVGEQLAPLGDLAASRSERDADKAAAQKARNAADKAELERRAAVKAAKEAARKEAARKEAARKEAARQEAARQEAARQEAARQEAARREAEAAQAAQAGAPRASAPAAAAPAPAGSFQQYALGKLGGNGSQFSCLESLWGKESGWNPNAQNPTSSAYGIAQFLDSTWAGTGVAKTSDGYRQIDAGLVYINNRYGSPCGAWSHSQANNWY